MKSFVYGGSKGIGLAIAKQLSKSGHIVYSISRNEPNDIKESDNINSLLNDINSFVPPKKLSDSLKEGPINIVFSQRYRGKDEIQEINTMLYAPIKIMDKISKDLKSNSNIIFIGSTASFSTVYNQNALYHATRGAISSLAKYYAVKLAINKVKVHLVNPTTTIKSYNEEYFKQNKDLSNKIREKIPMAEIPNENDIAICIDNLLSGNWPSLTGVSLNIDGGTSLLYPGL